MIKNKNKILVLVVLLSTLFSQTNALKIKI
jgi:hypothetical protein